MKKSSIDAAILLILIGLIALVVLIYVNSHQTCTMGVSGTAANVTFEGTQVQQYFCSNPEGWTFGSHFYALDQPQGVILCEGNLTLNGETAHYTVRDTGLLDIAGSGLCKWLDEGAPTNP